MSTGSHYSRQLPRGPDVLGELLHSVSQPLTSLRCSLELSLDPSLDVPINEVVERQRASVSAALHQTENVIGVIQLMREYLDAEEPISESFSCALAPVIRTVTEELSSIVAVRGIRLRLVGTCIATIPVPESRLRLALQYLISMMIDGQPMGGTVMLLLGEGPAGAVLRAEGERGFHAQKRGAAGPQITLRAARIAIAGRIFERAGASLVVGDNGVGDTGFVLRVPRRVGVSAE